MHGLQLTHSGSYEHGTINDLILGSAIELAVFASSPSQL
jgi:hypothetical protein